MTWFGPTVIFMDKEATYSQRQPNLYMSIYSCTCLSPYSTWKCSTNKMLEDTGKSFTDVNELYFPSWNSQHMEMCPQVSFIFTGKEARGLRLINKHWINVKWTNFFQLTSSEHTSSSCMNVGWIRPKARFKAIHYNFPQTIL